MRTLLPVAALLLGLAILVVGNGLQLVLLPVRAQLEGFPLSVIGAFGTTYNIGFVAGCLLVPRMVKNVGHIRTFAALAAIAASASLVHGLLIGGTAWAILRCASGFCFAGLWMVVESWLNERAVTTHRGQLVAVYMMINAAAGAGGQMLLPLTGVEGLAPFTVAGIAICLSLVPVALTTAAAPAPIASARLDLARLYRTSPVAVFGCLLVGLANGALWALGPLFAQARGMPTSGVALFMTAVVVGGALVQWPLGRLSDRFDRRRVIAVACIAAAAAGMALAAIPAAGDGAAMVLAGALGAFAFPLYSLCIAHANDHADAQDFVAVSGGLLLTFGLGAVAGPLLGAAAMTGYGEGALFMVTAISHLALATVTILRMRRQAPVPEEQRSDFVPVTRTTPAVFELDPRSDVPTEAEETSALAG